MRFFLSISLIFIVHVLVHAQCPQNLSITSNAEIATFQAAYPNCTDLPGNLSLSSISLTNLAGLENIAHVGGDISIHHTGLNNLNGLSGLVDVDGTIRIFRNSNPKT